MAARAPKHPHRCSHLGAEGAGVEAAGHEGAKDVADGRLAGRRHVEDGKLALEAVGDVVAPAARRHHGRHKPAGGQRRVGGTSWARRACTACRLQRPTAASHSSSSSSGGSSSSSHPPCVHHKLHVPDGLLQPVHAALLQQLAHNLVGDLHRLGGGVAVAVARCWANVATCKQQGSACTTPHNATLFPAAPGRPAPSPQPMPAAHLVAPVVDGGHGDVVDEHRQCAAAGRPVGAALPLLHHALQSPGSGAAVCAGPASPSSPPALPRCDHVPPSPPPQTAAPARPAPRWPAGRCRAW